ncbi:unnamed protein product [Lepeophtheirus salmonis]|uniref:(salmon louse) hypothetical protein n=1 Tax=Lepeophtheirus salmonis TaxID=72036 RepID=A0A7R8CDS1_LEPSM|nr:unnamed protein product [Lepeophtheirus salmonis]CAF2782721.1 unnamed protein product [Lepeophtheirus salmonis]
MLSPAPLHSTDLHLTAKASTLKDFQKLKKVLSPLILLTLSFTSIFQTTSVKEEDTTSERPVKLIKKESDSEPEEDLLPSDEELEVQWSGIDLFILAVKLSLWIALWGVAIKWEIGIGRKDPRKRVLTPYSTKSVVLLMELLRLNISKK